MLGNTKFFAAVVVSVGAVVASFSSPAYAPEAVASPMLVTYSGSTGLVL